MSTLALGMSPSRSNILQEDTVTAWEVRCSFNHLSETMNQLIAVTNSRDLRYPRQLRDLNEKLIEAERLASMVEVVTPIDYLETTLELSNPVSAFIKKDKDNGYNNCSPVALPLSPASSEEAVGQTSSDVNSDTTDSEIRIDSDDPNEFLKELAGESLATAVVGDLLRFDDEKEPQTVDEQRPDTTEEPVSHKDQATDGVPAVSPPAVGIGDGGHSTPPVNSQPAIPELDWETASPGAYKKMCFAKLADFQDEKILCAMRVNNSQADFYVAPMAQMKQFLKMEKELQVAAEVMQAANFRLKRIVKHCPCVAQYSVDERFYRAEVLVVPSSESGGPVFVRFVDYGNTSFIEMKDLLPLPLHFADLPTAAIFCRLVDTDTRELKIKVQDAFRDRFPEGMRMLCQVLHRRAPTREKEAQWEIDLFDVRTDECLTTELKTKKKHLRRCVKEPVAPGEED